MELQDRGILLDGLVELVDVERFHGYARREEGWFDEAVLGGRRGVVMDRHRVMGDVLGWAW